MPTFATARFAVDLFPCNRAAKMDGQLRFESGNDPSNVLAAGFGSEALADAFAVTGEAARIDRGVLNDRRDAILRGDFLPPDFDPRNFPGGFAGLEGAFQGRGGREGGNPNFQGRGGREGNPNAQGRGGARGNNPNFRGGQRIQVTSTYGFSGSALNSAPRQLRSEVQGVEPKNANHNYNVSSQIPIKIPGVYSNPNNRTMVQFTLSGNRGTNPFDQYATVPTDAMRAEACLMPQAELQLRASFKTKRFRGHKDGGGRRLAVLPVRPDPGLATVRDRAPVDAPGGHRDLPRGAGAACRTPARVR